MVGQSHKRWNEADPTFGAGDYLHGDIDWHFKADLSTNFVINQLLALFSTS